MSRPTAIHSIASLTATVVLAGCGGGADTQRADAGAPGDYETAAALVLAKDVPYIPTPQPAVEEMLRMANVSREDLVYDLGSGDGRIVIAAAKNHGARGVGIDIDPNRIREANQNAHAAGVTDRVRFVRGDLFEADLRDATVVTLYLLPAVNVRLRPKLLAELAPGTPVVSHDFDMGEWEPDARKRAGPSRLYLWIVPARVDRRWSWTMPDGQRRVATLRQEFQKLDGRLDGSGAGLVIRNGRVRGEEISFELTRAGTGNAPALERYRGRVNGSTIAGTAEAGERRWSWSATRE